MLIRTSPIMVPALCCATWRATVLAMGLPRSGDIDSHGPRSSRNLFRSISLLLTTGYWHPVSTSSGGNGLSSVRDSDFTPSSCCKPDIAPVPADGSRHRSGSSSCPEVQPENEPGLDALVILQAAAHPEPELSLHSVRTEYPSISISGSIFRTYCVHFSASPCTYPGASSAYPRREDLDGSF